MKAKLGMRKVRPWKWMPFTNPARRDGLVLYHWRRAAEKGQDYAFAKFNKKHEVRHLHHYFNIHVCLPICLNRAVVRVGATGA